MVFTTVQWHKKHTSTRTQTVLINVVRISFELCKHGLHFNLFDFYLSWIMTLSFNCLAHCCKNVLHIMSLNSLITTDIQRGSFIISILFVHVYEKRANGKLIWSTSDSWMVLASILSYDHNSCLPNFMVSENLLCIYCTYIGSTQYNQNGSYTNSTKFSCFYNRKFFGHESFIKS